MRFLLGVAALNVACAQPSAAGAPPVSSSADAAAATAERFERDAATVEKELTWVVAVRYGRWADAARLLGELPKKRRESPKMRFVTARVALESGAPHRALELLDDLEKELPQFADEITRDRARGWLEAGPHEDAAEYFASHPSAASQQLAARAFERCGKLDRAVAAAERAVHVSTLGKSQEDRAERASARALRAELLERTGYKKRAARDWRWLATQRPTSPHAEGADEKLASLLPSEALTAAERRDRALEFGKAGQLERALEELKQIEGARGSELPEAELVHAEGFVYYFSRQDYMKASALFDRASKMSQKLRIRDAFYSARALSRANEDEAAIRRYAALAQQYPGTSYAEEASYLVARLTFLLGNWEGAAAAYKKYLVRHGTRGRFAQSARYERAISLIALGQGDPAADLLSDLIARERSDTELAILNELRAVALEVGGHRDEAAALYRRVIAEHPLTFAALASTARLVALGEIPPAPITKVPLEEKPEPISVRLPPRVEWLREIGLDADAESVLAEGADDFVARHAPRGYEALCEAYGRLAPARSRYRVAHSVVKSSVLEVAPTAASRWAWNCLYPRAYSEAVEEAGGRLGVPPEFLLAVMRQESAFRADAVSSAYAVGLMQLIPPTARRVAGELGEAYVPERLRSPDTSIRYGSHYMARLLDRFGDRPALAAAAYNAGPQAVSRWLEKSETLPLDLWVAYIPYSETRHYVHRVYSNYARYAYLDGGDASVPVLDLTVPKGCRALPEDY